MTEPTATEITVQQADFEQGAQYCTLAQGCEAGAIVTFVGKVRDFIPEAQSGQGDTANSLWLEHYPDMTEAVLANIVEQARARWPILRVRIVHRIGQLKPGEQIVFVGVSSKHRKTAFNACEFIMDFLKTQAPFWKKEGSHWVEAKQSDNQAASQWLDHDPHKNPQRLP